MECPVCGEHLGDAGQVLEGLDRRYAPCHACSQARLDPRAPPPEAGQPCACGRRPLDQVMAAVHAVLADGGGLAPGAPLAAVGTPLLHPFPPLRSPPFLPPSSLILLTRYATPSLARRLLAEVPEVRGVVADRGIVPGVGGATHDLLAGCDVYAEARFTPAGPLVLYKQVSTCHIEAPRPRDPKVEATDRAVRRVLPDVFVDACAGVGTLGLAAALRLVPAVVLNDAWGPAAWFAGLNLHANREALLAGEVDLLASYADLRDVPAPAAPEPVAAARADQEILVYRGSLWDLPPLLPVAGLRLAALDPFEKDPDRLRRIARRWQDRAGGEVFIP
ncbi:MAG: hypothetical protein GXY82_06310 [Methanospirillum sp.]|nr:hypothetical protein [Methanospirillum sp.]